MKIPAWSSLPIGRKKDYKMNFLTLTRRIPVWTLPLTLFAMSGVLPAGAQEALPHPQPPFKGHIGLTPKDSTLDFPQEAKAPKGAPNILLILTDDVGFGASSTFGGPIPTPTMDRLAAQGLRYTQFHTTALCSPTRSALLTGRNHHSNATGVIMELGTGFPGYNTLMPKTNGTFAEVLRQNGYNTICRYLKLTPSCIYGYIGVYVKHIESIYKHIT